MLDIQMIPVNKIKPDPKQPRKSFNDDDIKGIAANMKEVEGHVINPIEVDATYMIITGERRWRAAKLLGLKEIRCVVIDIDEDTRFFRQVSENVHHNTMTDWDTANAIHKLLKDRGVGDPHLDTSISMIASKLGKSRRWVSSMLAITKESEGVKQFVKDGKITASLIDAANRAPEDYQEMLKKRYVDRELSSQKGIREIAQALKRNPEAAEELLSRDFTGMSEVEVINIARSFSPSDSDIARSEADEAVQGKELWDTISKLEAQLHTWPPNRLGEQIRPMVGMAIISLLKNLQGYLERANLNQIEDEN